jgi:Malectin domain
VRFSVPGIMLEHPRPESSTLHCFALDSFTTAGQRVFDVVVETTTIDDINVFPAFTATNKTVTVVSTDGALTVLLLDNVPLINFPTIAGIEINRLSNVTSVTAPVVPPPKAASPTASPVTKRPVAAPTKAPVAASTMAPVSAPTKAAGAAPTKAPLKLPVPTEAPKKVPTTAPALAPVQPTVPTFEPILINCGGGAYTDTQRRVWSADKYNEGGQLYATGTDILGTEDDELYRSHRWGQLMYKIPVPLGSYEVVLHSAEI